MATAVSQKSDVTISYLRPRKKFPSVWCPGCGNGIVMSALIRAIDKLGLTKDEVVLVSGIGCSSRLPVYLDFNSLPGPLQAVFYAIPYSHPIIASKAVIAGDYLTVVFGIIYVAVFTVVIMYIASRLFATEKILTAKLMFSRKGKKKQESD